MTTLATEPATLEQKEESRRLEQWGETERMRHIPPHSWIVSKLDGDVRRMLNLLLGAVESNDAGALASEVEQGLARLTSALERLCEISRQGRGSHYPPPSDRQGRMRWLFDQAANQLKSVDPDLFGRRAPFHLFERSKSEPLYGAFLSLLEAVGRLTETVRRFDPAIDEAVCQGLVTLQTPLREEPIA